MAQAGQLNILEPGCPIQVEHDRKRRQFTVRLNGCHDKAVLLYEYVGKRIVDLQHTEVPDAYRGRGIAKHLAKRENKRCPPEGWMEKRLPLLLTGSSLFSGSLMLTNVRR
ncbi:protein NATD1 isoform X2 [Lacerta agilis]|uniref:protein NATD1 isoform X2 n=1 Tax=Lacerta agilis TaxID=80427 RepID=UPI001419801E|nr:protein NATD1 isoform X2 [Lacerta agilis]